MSAKKATAAPGRKTSRRAAASRRDEGLVLVVDVGNTTSVFDVSFSGMSGRSRRGGSMTPSQSARPAASSSRNEFVRTQPLR